MTSPIMPVYSPAPITPVRGLGNWLYEEDGTAWLDCVGGVASNALGHCHPKMVAALAQQANLVWHVSNGMQIPGQHELANKLTAASFADRVFFANTGTEAVEAAVKLARRYHAHNGQTERVDIIGFHGSFHGRTYGALNAAGNARYLEGFGPSMPGFHHVATYDSEAIARLISAPGTAAVIVEPVQGEGGARAMTGDWLRSLRQQCRSNDVLLIYDEVQCGMGRTGRLFAHQWFENAEPDVMALAKGIGSGFPVSACLATREASAGMVAGTHGSTYGGNPLAMAVANTVFDEIAGDHFLKASNRLSQRLREGLVSIAANHPEIINDIRGKGLLIGIQLHPSNREFISLARKENLLLAGGGDNIIRLLPSLNSTETDADEILLRISATCQRMKRQAEQMR
jgi:acetylornithine/N-succinyldiaminopimelate aminotransferase